MTELFAITGQERAGAQVTRREAVDAGGSPGEIGKRLDRGVEGRAVARAAAVSTAGISQVARSGKRVAATNYRRFAIVAGPYQLFESGRWTVELKIRRNGRGEAFSLAEHCPTEQEAEARCFVVGRQIIDGRVPGLSVDHLRIARRGGAFRGRVSRAGLLVTTAVTALWALAFVV